MVDVLIVGGGPAGCSAALTCRRRNLSVTMVYSGDGALAKAHRIDNYPGTPRIEGQELLRLMREQAAMEGAVLQKGLVQTILPMGESFSVLVQDQVLEAKSVILACGTGRVNFLENEESLLGQGVSYCATCDGMFFKDKEMIVIGASEEAIEEANYLAELGHVRYLIEKKHDTTGLHPSIELVPGVPQALQKDERGLTVFTKQEEAYKADGVFIFRPAVALTQLLPGLESEKGAVKVDTSCATNIPGVFAAGDMIGGTIQLTNAVGEGTTAALSAASYVSKMNKAEK